MEPLKGLTLILVTLALSFGAAMDALDISIANVCIPDISGDLDVSPFRGTWIISSYALTNATMILLSGFLALRIGEVRLFTISIIVFTIASLLCGLATSFEMLVAFRLLQGMAAGPLVPLCQSLLLKSYPARFRTVGLSAALMILIIAPIFGPVLGGYITQTIGWRWIFFLNIPIGIFCAILTWGVLKNRETPLSRPPIDFIGLVLLMLGTGSFQLFLSLGPNHDWFDSPLVTIVAIFSLVTLSYFIVWTHYSEHPIIHFTLFKLRNYTLANALTFFAYIAFYAGFVLYPIWLQIELGYTALWAGYALVPLGVAILLVTPIAGLLSDKFRVDLRLLLSLSFVAFAISFFWAGRFTSQASFASLLGPRIVLGIALGLFCIPSYIVALSGIVKEELANAVSVFNFGRVIGIGIGTAIGVSSLETLQKIYYDSLLPTISYTNTQLTSILDKLQAGVSPPEVTMGWVHLQLISQSLTLAINSFFMIASFGFIILIALIWFLKPPFPQLEGDAL